MSLKYEVLKRLVKAANIKKQWTGMSTQALLENRRRANAKNRVPDLKDDAFAISQIDVMGFPVLKLIHREKAEKANLFLIGGGMISAPRPGSVKKALRFAKETGLDVYVPYDPFCTDWPLTKAYEMIHETYKVMLRDYPGRISVLGTSSGGNLALGMVPYINDGHGDTPMPGYIMAISPGTCADTDAEWQRMLELEQKDVAIPAQYMKTAVEIMRHGDDSVPDYMLWLQRGDFTSCPKTTFIAFELAVLVGWIALIARGTFALKKTWILAAPLIVAGIGFVLEYLIPWPFNGFASGFESFGWMLVFLGGRKLVARAIQEQSDTEREP